MSDVYQSRLWMAVHLRRDHDWTWKRLKVEFPGMGGHFWDEVRYRVEGATDE